MPLFMDIHIVEDDAFNVIAAREAHHDDLAVQDRYGVRNIKYFLNLPEKKVFCLMEAADKKACVDMHLSAHGIGPCNVIEVSDEIDFRAFLGQGTKNQDDLALTLNGEIDTGYRTLMMVALVDFTGKNGTYFDEVRKLIRQYQGNNINQPNDYIVASFVHASDAIACCLTVSRLLKNVPMNIDYTMAVVTGKPVDETGSDFFGEAKKRLQMLCRLGGNRTVHIDKDTEALLQTNFNKSDTDKGIVKLVSDGDFVLFETLWKTLNHEISNPDFKIDDLNNLLGLSKAQAYRKIKALTGMSPNELIREMRLRKSLEFLNQKEKTVAEIAYELGFNSPTYFTRVFRKRYEMLPTTFAKLSS
ncbi:AraC family transcriptional regulator [Ulvibacterium marinum]|uniref:DUF4242 domain-containing protein n=1 Tax=Ulvibacterium marinum TaxID=2419782 RepID=A0A3B0CCR8_9FLAO|nr:helix-turn-helix domain-containing protein [Ulvibacterium marinum]RKN82288.1 DUF4242 domain-containing protein [Ulvibacterium marinum]